MISLKLTVHLTSTVPVRINSLCDKVTAFALQQEDIVKEFTSSLLLNSLTYYKA